MSRHVASGWYGDPGRKHEHRFWDGNRWTASVSDHGNVSDDDVIGEQFGPPGSGDRLAQRALAVLIGGGAAALVTTVAWGVWTGTSSTLDEQNRVRGWTAVWRILPTAAFAWSIPVIAMVLAVRACQRGSMSLGRLAIWLSGVVLFVVSLSNVSGTVESALTGSHPGLKWMLLPVSIAISAVGTMLALRAAKRPPTSAAPVGDGESHEVHVA